MLLVPLALWLVPGVFGALRAIGDGHGNPLAILGLWALYGPIELALTLAAGVALGRVSGRRKRRA